jgi:hypothetical protein
MQRLTTWSLGFLVLVFPAALAAAQTPKTAAPPAKAALQASSVEVKRGTYLLQTMGCDDCHTPHKMGPKGLEPDMAFRLSGHPAGMQLPPAPQLGNGPWIWAGVGTMTAFAGPWGVSFAANLTPEVETGLGSWTEKMFFDAMRTGRHLGKGRPILPPMPYWAVGAATDQDLRAIFASLKSLPPIKNKVPDALDPPQAAR